MKYIDEIYLNESLTGFGQWIGEHERVISDAKQGINVLLYQLQIVQRSNSFWTLYRRIDQNYNKPMKSIKKICSKER